MQGGGGGGGGGYNNMGSYGTQNGGDYGPQRSNYNQSNRSSGPYGGIYFINLNKYLDLFLLIDLYYQVDMGRVAITQEEIKAIVMVNIVY